MSSITTAPFRKRKNRRMTARVELPVGRIAMTVLSLALGGATIAGAAFGIQQGWEALRRSERLQVAMLDVRGTRRTSAAEVQAYTGIRIGEAILDVDLDAAALALRRHPWVKNATVTRSLPDRVAVDIEEHVPRLLVALGDLYLAGPDGKIFKVSSPGDAFASAVLTGLSRERAASDPEGTAAVVREAIAIDEAAAGTELGRLEEIAWDKDLGWSVVTRPRSIPVRVHLGRSPVSRIPLAVQAVHRLAELGQTAEEIWADGNERRVQARPAQRSNEPQPLIAKIGE